MQAEGRVQRVTLRWRQPLEAVEQGRTELMERRKGKLHLRLDAERAEDAIALAALGDVVQERCLADAGLSADHQRCALARAYRGQQLLEPRTLRRAAAQRREPLNDHRRPG